MNSYKISRVYKTLNEMLNDRGYKSKTLSEEELQEHFETNDNLLVNFVHKKKDLSIECVFYQPFLPEKKQISIEKIKTLTTKYKELKDKHIILVCSNGLNHHAVKEINATFKDNEVFHNKQLYVNITKHVLNPKFELLENTNMFENGLKNNLPLIKNTDPMCIYFNAKAGNVFEITRPDNSIYYRLVVN